jgi:hypothetical protein
LTAYGRVALAPADVVVPVAAPHDPPDTGRAELLARVAAQADGLCPPHRRVDVPTDPGLLAALEACPVGLSTMGRGLGDDPDAFLASAVAGVHAEGIRPVR